MYFVGRVEADGEAGREAYIPYAYFECAPSRSNENVLLAGRLWEDQAGQLRLER